MMKFFTKFSKFAFTLLLLVSAVMVNAATITSAGSGNWSNGATWVGGILPGLADDVVIASGHNVTLDANQTVLSTNIGTGGTLTVAANTLTIKSTTVNVNTSVFTIAGTLTMSGGQITVLGRVVLSGIFNQSGGDLKIDGHNGTVGATNNVTTAMLNITSTAVNAINLTGGSITFPDPFPGTSTTAGACECIYFNTGTSYVIAPGHTINFGDGVSTSSGGST